MMSYVRRFISEEIFDDGRVLQRFEMERPPKEWFGWTGEHGWAGYIRLFDDLAPLTTLELQLTKDVAKCFSNIPYLLAAEVWRAGLHSYCDRSFCCNTIDVLYWYREPFMWFVTDIDNYRGGPITLIISWPEDGVPENRYVWTANRRMIAHPNVRIRRGK